jgi:hypothetical protein
MKDYHINIFYSDEDEGCLFDKVSVTRNGKTESKTDYAPIQGDIVEQQ